MLFGIQRKQPLYFEVALLIAMLGFVGTAVAWPSICCAATSSNEAMTGDATCRKRDRSSWFRCSCVLGAVFALLGSLGLARLPDFYTRLHGPTKATTLGVGGMLVASMLYFSARGDGPSLHELLITLFLFITTPVSAHMLAKAALHLKLRRDARTRGAPEN